MINEPIERILRLRAVLDRTGLSRSTLYRKIQQGTFPRQLKLNPRCAGWRESEVRNWTRDLTVGLIDEPEV